MILQQCGFEKTLNFSQSHFDLSKEAIPVQKTRERSDVLDRTLIEQLDAVTDCAHFRDDVLDEKQSHDPLPDKVTKESFNHTTARRNV